MIRYIRQLVVFYRRLFCNTVSHGTAHVHDVLDNMHSNSSVSASWHHDCAGGEYIYRQLKS